MADAMTVLHDVQCVTQQKCPVHHLLLTPGYLIKLYCPLDTTVSGYSVQLSSLSVI